MLKLYIQSFFFNLKKCCTGNSQNCKQTF